MTVDVLERDRLTSGTTWHAAGLLGRIAADSAIVEVRHYSLHWRHLEPQPTAAQGSVY